MSFFITRGCPTELGTRYDRRTDQRCHYTSESRSKGRVSHRRCAGRGERGCGVNCETNSRLTTDIAMLPSSCECFVELYGYVASIIFQLKNIPKIKGLPQKRNKLLYLGSKGGDRQ